MPETSHGSDVFCLIRDKEQMGEKAFADWEHNKQKIETYVQKKYNKKISDLIFYDYQTNDGREIPETSHGSEGAI